MILRVTPAPDLQTQLSTGNCPPAVIMLVPKAQCSAGAEPLRLLPTPNAGACYNYPMPAPPSSAYPSPSSKPGLVGTLLLSKSRYSHDQAPHWQWKAGLPAALH